MTASVATTPVSDYTWDGALFAWNTATALHRTWATATINSIAVSAQSSFAVTDALRRVSSLNRKESVSVIERVGKVITKGSFAESMSLSDSFDRDASYRRSFASALVLGESLARGSRKDIAESFSAVDGATRQVSFKRAFSEQIGIVDSYVDYIAFMIRVSETVTIAEKLGKHARMAPFEDAFALTDAIVKHSDLGLPEQVIFEEVFSRAADFYVELEETVELADLMAKHFESSHLDPLGVSDSLVKGMTRRIAEQVAITETFARVVVFRRALAEGVRFAEALKRATTLDKSELLDIAEEYRRHANAVISDLHVAEGDITDLDFRQMLGKGAPPDYSDFRPFLAGDHEYQDALFKVIMKGLNMDMPQLRGLSIEVDVPDIFDRGTAETAAGASVFVAFKRTFYVPPEIVLQLKGGAVVATPRIIGEIQTDGFYLALEDSGGSYVAGEVTWAAHGY